MKNNLHKNVFVQCRRNKLKNFLKREDNMELIDVLNAVCVINKDNGRKFMETERIDAITSLLWNIQDFIVNAERNLIGRDGK